MCHSVENEKRIDPVTVVVTEEMMEAGFRVFASSGITDDPLESDKRLLSEIYRTMYVLSPHPTCREIAG